MAISQTTMSDGHLEAAETQNPDYTTESLIAKKGLRSSTGLQAFSFRHCPRHAAY
jgi:hypothetical protein